jgi:hypothetical protein
LCVCSDRPILRRAPPRLYPLHRPTVNRLIEIGFQQAGHWRLEDGKLVADLARLATQRNILYAFICDGEVKYIGKTASSLAGRMRGYRNPAETQTTNIRNNSRILDTLAAGGTVDIYALPDNGLLHYGAFHLNLAAGLEDDLIRVVNPQWNGGRTEPAPVEVEEQPQSAAPLDELFEGVKHSFTFVLQPTYYRTGFFNVGVGDEALLGGDGETIEIFIDSDPEPVLGKINRTANTNQTPRIMGGTALRDWFQAKAAVKDPIRVDVFSPTAIRLASPPHAKSSSSTPTEPADAGT